jgi:sterol desaturase/sphingolipid hydroxylase (fatty acid hydroxylase superfamily)
MEEKEKMLFMKKEIRQSLIFAVLMSILTILAFIFNKEVYYYIAYYQNTITIVILYAALVILTGYYWGKFLFKKMMR